jgi:hypothetical protein
LNGLAVRVPLTNSSITDCVFEVKRSTTAEEVNALLKEAADTYLKGILGFEEQPLVSTDYVNDARSSIVDAACTQVSVDHAKVNMRTLLLPDIKIHAIHLIHQRPDGRCCYDACLLIQYMHHCNLCNRWNRLCKLEILCACRSLMAPW